MHHKNKALFFRPILFILFILVLAIIPQSTIYPKSLDDAYVCKAFLTAKKISVSGQNYAGKMAPGHLVDNGCHDKHDFKIHIIPCDAMDVSVGDSADVFVDADKSGTFDQDENYLAIVNSIDSVYKDTDIRIDIKVKVYIGEDLINNDPCVAIYSINDIQLKDTLGNTIDYLCLDTFSPNEETYYLTSEAPEKFTLLQSYPNPFNPVCNIRYALSEDGHVNLSIYNILGQKVRVLVSEYQNAGIKSVIWDGKDDLGREVSAGVYFYRIEAGSLSQSKKMMFIK